MVAAKSKAKTRRPAAPIAVGAQVAVPDAAVAVRRVTPVVGRLATVAMAKAPPSVLARRLGVMQGALGNQRTRQAGRLAAKPDQAKGQGKSQGKGKGTGKGNASSQKQATGPSAAARAATSVAARAPAAAATPQGGRTSSAGAATQPKALGFGASALASSFLASSASSIAKDYSKLGTRLQASFVNDRKQIVSGTPPLQASIHVEAPGGAAAGAPVAGAASSAAAGIQPSTKKASPKETASKNKGAHAADPVFRPDAKTDLNNAGRDLHAGQGQAAASGQAMAAELAAHPGGEQVQPVATTAMGSIDLPAPEQAVQTPESPEMADYAALDLPDSVRKRADQKLAPRLDGSLAGPRSKVAKAQETEETQRADALDHATKEADQLSEATQKQQDDVVAGARSDIEGHKDASVKETQGELDKFDKSASDRHRETVDKAQSRIDADQKTADAKVAAAHEKAEKERREGEKKKAAERRKAARKKKNRSIWQKIGDFFSKIAKALASAVKSIVNAVEKLVNAVLDAAKKFVASVVKALSDAIQGMLKAFAGILKGLVNNLIGKIFPGIAAKLNAAIDAVVDVACKAVQAVADGLNDAVDWLVSKAQQAVAAAASLARAAIAIASGLVVGLLTGDFLEALKMAFLAACEEVGLPGQQLLDMLERAGKLIWEVIKHPATFLKHLLKSVWGGIKLFVADIVPNFAKGLMGWIFGEVAATGIVLPEKFDLRGILGILLQVVGLTLENVRAQAVNVLGEDKVQFAGGVIKFIGILFAKGPGAFFSQLVVGAKALPGLMFESAANWAEARFGPRGRAFVEGIRADFDALLSGGPAALLKQMMGQLSSIKDAVIDGIRQWIMEKVVAVAVEKLATMTNPVGGFIQAILMIYRTIKFFVERIKQILEVVNRILDSIETVAKGLIQVAARAIDKTMIATLPLVVSFMADLIGFGGIGEKVRKIVAKIQAPVNKAVVWLFTKIKKGIEWVVSKLFGLAKSAKNKVMGKKEAAGKGGRTDHAADGDIENVLAQPPAKSSRNKAAQQSDVQEAAALTNRIVARSKTTEDVADYFPRIKKRFALKAIGFEGLGTSRAGVQIAVNPEAFIDAGNSLAAAGPMQASATNLATSVDFGPAMAVSNLPGANGTPLANTQAQVGTWMRANRLGPEHPQGSNTGACQMDVLMQRLAPGLFYRKGHLLNANLGGPGTDPRNLFPITQQANSLHSARIESEVQSAVNVQRRWVGYSVNVQQQNVGGNGTIIDSVLQASYCFLNAQGNPIGNPKVVQIHSLAAGGGVVPNQAQPTLPSAGSAQEPNAAITPELATNNPPTTLKGTTWGSLRNALKIVQAQVAVMPQAQNPNLLMLLAHRIQLSKGFGPNRAAALALAVSNGVMTSTNPMEKTAFTLANKYVQAGQDF